MKLACMLHLPMYPLLLLLLLYFRYERITDMHFQIALNVRITSKFRLIAMFIKVHTRYVSVITVYKHTRFHTHSPNVSLAITLNYDVKNIARSPSSIIYVFHSIPNI